MNRSAKICLVSSIFVITGLCGSLSYAVPEVEIKSAQQVTLIKTSSYSIAMNSNTNSITYSYAYPSITSEIFAENKKIGIPSFSNISRQPMQGIQVTDFAHIAPNKFQKKNVIFEFAAKFNDKLQQILSIFEFSSASTVVDKESASDKGQQRKLHLTSSIGNCITNKN